jgi:hypothetical protein
MLRRRSDVGFRGKTIALGTAAVLAFTPTVHAAANPAAVHPIPPPASVAGEIVPIDWSRFDDVEVGDPAGKRLRALLLNANRYALTTWWDTRFSGQQDAEILDLGGVSEHQIREVAAQAYALTSSLRTGAYDENVVGVAEPLARQRAIVLTRSLAVSHAANRSGGWSAGWVATQGGSDTWQSGMWAAMAGFAGWMLWDDLDTATRSAVQGMLEYEAYRFTDYKVPYWTTEDGVERFPGDTKAEDSSWNAMLLQVATAAMPCHPMRSIWTETKLELMISAFARPSDATSERMVNGRPLGEWLSGWNVTEDGLAVNHGIVHPDYMTTVPQNLQAVQTATLAGLPVAEGALHNADLVYEALVDHEFTHPPYNAPGGTMYRDGSDGVYFPEGQDWGDSRRMNFAAMDATVDALDLDEGVSTPAGTWEERHAGAALAMQQRFADGRTYGPDDSDTYRGREGWVAMHAAWAWMTEWIVASGDVRFSDREDPSTAALCGPPALSRADLDGASATASSAQGPLPWNPVAQAPWRAIDGDPATHWTAEYNPAKAELPQWLEIRLPRAQKIHQVLYRPRADDSTNGAITRYRLEGRTPSGSWTTVAAGTWAPDRTVKTATVATNRPLSALRLVALEGVGGFATVGELTLTTWPGHRVRG